MIKLEITFSLNLMNNGYIYVDCTNDIVIKYNQKKEKKKRKIHIDATSTCRADATSVVSNMMKRFNYK